MKNAKNEKVYNLVLTTLFQMSVLFVKLSRGRKLGAECAGVTLNLSPGFLYISTFNTRLDIVIEENEYTP